jgi:anti-sigma-K factor RskA
MPEYEARADTPKAKKKKWPWIVAATAVVVGGGVAAGVLLSQRSKNSGQPAVGGVTVNW